MCGIVAYTGSEEAAPKLIEALKKLQYRGYDSWGIATSNEHGISYLKNVGSIDNAVGLYPLSGKSGIGHTRWATHGGVTQANAHPHLDCKEQIAVVHNGIIDNFEELRLELIAKGHVFKSETDTEVIAHLFEALGEWGEKKVLSCLEGSYALAILFSNGKVVGARKGSPLIAAVDSNGSCWLASDPLCLPSTVNRYCSLDEGEIVFLPQDKAKIVSRSVLTRSEFWAVSKKEEHYMMSEILEQPAALDKVILQDKDLFNETALSVLRSRQLIVVGAGSSYHAAILGKYYFSQIAKKFSEIALASDFPYLTGILGPETTVVAISQSGETRDVIEAVQKAKEKGSSIVSIVNKPHSQLSGISDLVLNTNCGPEVGVAATKSFLSQVAVLYLLAHAMNNSFYEAILCISRAIEKVKESIEQGLTLEPLSRLVATKESVYFIARGVNVAVAREGALKLKEISYLHAESMPAGELKHGALSLVSEGTPVVVVCPNGLPYSDTIVNAIEAKSRGGYIIGVSDEYNSVFDSWVKTPVVEDGLLFPLVTMPPLQLLAYYTAIARGNNPDRPRNLAKSVTVK